MPTAPIVIINVECMQSLPGFTLSDPGASTILSYALVFATNSIKDFQVYRALTNWRRHQIHMHRFELGTSCVWSTMVLWWSAEWLFCFVSMFATNSNNRYVCVCMCMHRSTPDRQIDARNQLAPTVDSTLRRPGVASATTQEIPGYDMTPTIHTKQCQWQRSNPQPKAWKVGVLTTELMWL